MKSCKIRGNMYRLSCLQGAVSLAGAASGLWAVDGGNKRVCSGLLYNSKSELVTARVTSISVKVRPSKAGTFYILHSFICYRTGHFLSH